MEGRVSRTPRLFVWSWYQLFASIIPFSLVDRQTHVACFTSIPSRIRHTKGDCSLHRDWVRRFRQYAVSAKFEKESGEERCLSPSIVESLDMIPIIRAVASHTGTLRAKRALLTHIEKDEESKAVSSTRRRVVDPDLRHGRFVRSEGSHVVLSPFAHSADDARDEYELVRQAMFALNNSLENVLLYPPLYGADSSPWDTNLTPDTDDDEWLDIAIDQWTLEHVLQAEQIVRTLLNIHEWASSSAARIQVPGLVAIAERIPTKELERVHDEVAGAVEIVRWRTYSDPSRRQSFTFRICEERFPSLSTLRMNINSLSATIEEKLGVIQKKLKGTTEIIENEGRLVLSISRGHDLSQLGMIRGTSGGGGACYVEPHAIVQVGDQLAEKRVALRSKERDIEQALIGAIFENASAIERGLHIMARLDVVFAKAAFSYRINGAIPSVGDDGRIDVSSFVHPALTLRQDSNSAVVPIDLKVSGDVGTLGLIISGPNSGGKTVALKSFGLVASLCRLGIPIPLSHGAVSAPRVDYFENILVEVGDQQSLVEGESTLMARLNACSNILDHLAKTAPLVSPIHSLVLLDELGGGTDPTAGGAIAQAVLEKLLETDTCRVVATTHSPRLKALSYDSDQFQCATVLLDQQAHSYMYKRPTFQLQYGEIGDSYALGAAARCTPELPEDVLARAATLMSASEASDGEYVRVLTKSLENQLRSAKHSQSKADAVVEECFAYSHAMRSLASAYDRQWSALEERLETMYDTLQQENAPPMEVVGKTLGTLRLVRQKVKSAEELLLERGLRTVPLDYELQEGESVVILSPDELQGWSASVLEDGPIEVKVFPSWDGMSQDGLSDESAILTVPRHDLAIWDYTSVFDEFDGKNHITSTSVRESRQRLQSLLSTIKKPSPTSSSTPSATAGNPSSNASRYTSSRQRKAAAGKKKKSKKRNKS